MALTNIQKQTAQAIINIFETGSVIGDYASVVYVIGDPGELTYGAKQTTLASGNLYLLIKDYTETSGAQYGVDLKPYLPQFKARDHSLNTDKFLHGLLHRAGGDPVMIDVQDAFFDRVYWEPALRQANAIKIATALGIAVVFDSITHGSWSLIRDRTTKAHGSPDSIGEKKWIAEYVVERRNWLSNHKVKLLHKTVYRMDSFDKLITSSNWDLNLPITVRGLLIDTTTLTPHIRSPKSPTARLLLLTHPAMQGNDVKALQQALEAKGYSVGPDGVDGIFGEGTETAVKAFQTSAGVKVDGIVGDATRSALGIDD